MYAHVRMNISGYIISNNTSLSVFVLQLILYSYITYYHCYYYIYIYIINYMYLYTIRNYVYE